MSPVQSAEPRRPACDGRLEARPCRVQTARAIHPEFPGQIPGVRRSGSVPSLRIPEGSLLCYRCRRRLTVLFVWPCQEPRERVGSAAGGPGLTQMLCRNRGGTVAQNLCFKRRMAQGTGVVVSIKPGSTDGRRRSTLKAFRSRIRENPDGFGLARSLTTSATTPPLKISLKEIIQGIANGAPRSSQTAAADSVAAVQAIVPDVPARTVQPIQIPCDSR